MANVRIGIIGTGAIARTHAGILARDGRARVAAVYDVDAERAKAFAQDFGATVGAGVEDVLDAADAVYITAPNRTHAELTLKALDARKHVFCEKPFALNVEDARAIVRAVDTAGAVYQLGFSRRFAPAYRQMRTFIADGTMTPRSFTIKMNRGELQAPAWTSDAAITGGFLFESTLHLIDMVRYLLGEVKHVAAVGSKSVYPCVDNFSCIFAMESGAHGVFSSCAHATWIFPFERIELYGEHSAVYNDEMEAVTYCLGLGEETVTRRFSTLPIEDRWGFADEDRAFIDRIVGAPPDEPLYADARDGLRNVELIETIYDQIGLGR